MSFGNRDDWVSDAPTPPYMGTRDNVGTLKPTKAPGGFLSGLSPESRQKVAEKSPTGDNPESRQATTSPTLHPADEVEPAKLDKTQWHLIPMDAVACASPALIDGSGKHGAHNWATAPSCYSRHYDALLRHLTDWWGREEYSPDSPLVHHLDNALARLLFLRAYVLRGIGEDDRP